MMNSSLKEQILWLDEILKCAAEPVEDSLKTANGSPKISDCIYLSETWDGGGGAAGDADCCCHSGTHHGSEVFTGDRK